MCEKELKINIKDSSDVVEDNYESLNYQGEAEHETGLAETHEQVTNIFFEGTIDQLALNEKVED